MSSEQESNGNGTGKEFYKNSNEEVRYYKDSKKRIPKWRIVERPLNPPKYNKGSIDGMIKYFAINFGIAYTYLFIAKEIITGLPVYTYAGGKTGYDMAGNSAAYFVYFFMMVLPWMIVGYIHTKKKTPMYSFASLVAWVVAGLCFMPFHKFIGFYQAYGAGLLLLANIPSQKDWRLYNRDIIYFIIVGILDNYINTEIMIWSEDVWVYLQFIHVYLITAIAISLKIDKWAYFFMIGWALYSVYSIAFMGKDYVLVGIYNLIAPAMLTAVVLFYFYKIYKPNRYKMFVENPLKRKMVKDE